MQHQPYIPVRTPRRIQAEIRALEAELASNGQLESIMKRRAHLLEELQKTAGYTSTGNTYIIFAIALLPILVTLASC